MTWPYGEIGKHKGLINPCDSQTSLSQTVSVSLKKLSVPTFLFSPEIYIRNQGKIISVN